MRHQAWIGTQLFFVSALFLTANDAGAQAPAQTFAALQSHIKPGLHVTVWTDDDRKITGRLTSVTGNQVEIRRRRWFRLQEPEIFVEASVRRIVHHDSDWNGALIGVGLGTLVTLLANDECDNSGVVCNYIVLLAPSAGLVVGGLIDRAITRTLYVSPRGVRVTLRPVLGRERVGLAAAVRF